MGPPKRSRDDSDGVHGGKKYARLDGETTMTRGTNKELPVLRPYPYFYYRDFSQVPDPDPLQALSPPGRVPNFPAKMMSILSRPELNDIVRWMDHGRSWKILKPREFEIRVIPTYFEHAKLSSFIRLANGWGFRRITQGRDRNSYYNEFFLRGLPHLCKRMKRHGVSEKQAADPEHEPDFYMISNEYPVPESFNDESILLPCILKGGPKARMPVSFGSSLPDTTMKTAVAALPETQQSQSIPTNPVMEIPSISFHSQPISIPNNPLLTNTNSQEQQAIALGSGLSHPMQVPVMSPQAMQAALHASSVNSQFAAGFAVATALTRHQFQLYQALTSYPNNNNGGTDNTPNTKQL